MTPKDYLEHALRPTKGSDPGVAAKNRIRQSITTLFPDRECFCLVRPVSNEKQLQNLDALPPGQLRPEFREVTPAASCCWRRLSVTVTDGMGTRSRYLRLVMPQPRSLCLGMTAGVATRTRQLCNRGAPYPTQ